MGLIKVDPQFDPKLSRVGAGFILIFDPKYEEVPIRFYILSYRRVG